MNCCTGCLVTALEELEHSAVFQATTSNLTVSLEKLMERRMSIHTSNISQVITELLLKTSSNV